MFAQLVEFLNNDKFRRIVDKYNGNRYIKHLTCWNQLLSLMFGQLSNRESLRDLIVVLEAHQSKCFHLDLGRKPVAKTTLVAANQNRDYRIFEESVFYMMAQAREKRAEDISSSEAKCMHLTRQRFRFAFRCSSRLSSARGKVDSKPISSIIWRHKCQPSIISLQLRYMMPRQCRKSLMRQVLSTSLIEDTETSGNYSAYRGWNPSSLSEPKPTCSTRVSGGSD